MSRHHRSHDRVSWRSANAGQADTNGGANDACNPGGGNNAGNAGDAAGNGSVSSFADLGVLFNDATAKLVGGVDRSNRADILQDLKQVQSGLETLIAENPDTFTGVAGIHARNVVDQINLEIDAIKSLGQDPFAPKYINDVQRDLIDIVQGDDVLASLANEGGKNGFAAVPDLLAPPAPFQGNAEQTEFMRQFAADAVNLGDRAVALADAGITPGGAEATQLIADVQAFTQNANAFTFEQGGIYSARFNNEFADEGVNGTATRALVHGLETGNADEVRAAAEVMAANAQDVAGNMLGIGDDPIIPNGGIPDQIDSFALAGTVFNDATSKLIGGVYSGNEASVIADLHAVQEALRQLAADDPGTFSGSAGLKAEIIANQLGQEIAAVDAAGAGKFDATLIHDIHAGIIDAVQGDATLQGLAASDDLQGFASLPDMAGPADAFATNRVQSRFLMNFTEDAQSIAADAVTAVQGGDTIDVDDLIQRINAFASGADAFVHRQGGAYEAQFANELALDGATGTIANALVEGLQSQDAELVEVAEQLLLETASNLADGQQASGGRGRGGMSHHHEPISADHLDHQGHGSHHDDLLS